MTYRACYWKLQALKEDDPDLFEKMELPVFSLGSPPIRSSETARDRNDLKEMLGAHFAEMN
ncbi:hypothetical protein CBS101457_002934 [Exobasidium rhododendri]|nr:hypothetical protein CBS101457_002934 [Exobasidium rhododendri]